MILRRLTKHVNDQNWFAVALDFFIVVVGILLAFQITNWNEARGERAQEIEYLSAMKRDVTYSIQTLNRSIGALEFQQDARKGLYKFSTDPDAILEPREMDRLVSRGLFSLERVNINQTTFETLKSSGQMSLIRSPDLVNALQELSAEADLSETDKNEDIGFAHRISDPLLVNEGEFNNIALSDLGAWGERVPWIKTLPEAGYDAELLRSQRFRNVVVYRTLFGEVRLDGLRGILERHTQILELIAAREAQLGVKP